MKPTVLLVLSCCVLLATAPASRDEPDDGWRTMQIESLKGLDSVAVKATIENKRPTDHADLEGLVESTLRKEGVPLFRGNLDILGPTRRPRTGILHLQVDICPEIGPQLAVVGRPSPYTVRVSVAQPVALLRDPSRTMFAYTWSSGQLFGTEFSSGPPPSTRKEQVLTLVKRFADDFRAANKP
jgi:hypothetical protein